MKRPFHYGAGLPLDRLIDAHLFIICPNNSGSTFLKKALATSSSTWNLVREGQHTFGFAGPSTIDRRLHRHWACDDRSISVFTDPGAYDWARTRQAWYFQAYSKNPDANIFVEKSPPFVLVVDQLARQFREPRFIFMVRDPYAMVEGLLRKSGPPGSRRLPNGARFQIAANHVMNCLRYQKRNIESSGSRGVFFSYETMCDQPRQAEELIRALVPELADVNLRQRIEVWEYDEELRNMNAQQIARLTEKDLREINDVFAAHQDLLDYFHYRLRM